MHNTKLSNICTSSLEAKIPNNYTIQTFKLPSVHFYIHNPITFSMKQNFQQVPHIFIKTCRLTQRDQLLALSSSRRTLDQWINVLPKKLSPRTKCRFFRLVRVDSPNEISSLNSLLNSSFWLLLLPNKQTSLYYYLSNSILVLTQQKEISL